MLSRPESHLPWDPYEEVVIAHYDASGGEWFATWWEVFCTAFSAAGTAKDLAVLSYE